MAKVNPVRVGIVGLGRAGLGMHAPAIEKRPGKFRIVAACDVIRSRREYFHKMYGATAYGTVEELIADPE